MMDAATHRTATFNEWHWQLCEYARKAGGSASTEAVWMRRMYDKGASPSEAWEAFINDEVWQ